MTLGSHQRCVGKSQVHLTPRWVIGDLGPFDLDPCAATVRPWDCARDNYTEADDGLSKNWHGMVWLNPPFDRYQVGKWIAKLASHGNGIALVHARTEAEWFRPIWQSASLIFFRSSRIKFYRPDGTVQPANSGAPPVFAAFGREASERLSETTMLGTFVSDVRVARDVEQRRNSFECEQFRRRRAAALKGLGRCPSGRSGALRVEPCCTVSRLRPPPAIARKST